MHPNIEHLQRRLPDWFPLLPRPRPTCRAVHDRVDEVRDLSQNTIQGRCGEPLASAAEAHNKAALLLSDCGLSDRAHELCWRQFDIFHSHAPLTPKAAKLALQPVVNLGRLHIRDHRADHAHQLLTHAYQALRTNTPSLIDGREYDLNELIDGRTESRQELVRFLWAVLLADGTRALTRAGRWGEARAHLDRHNGIGERMLDGRQVAILTHISADNHEDALNLWSTVPLPSCGSKPLQPA